MKDTHTSVSHSVKQSVLARLEAEAVTPTPKSVFMIREGLVWFLWAVTVLFGALALSVIVFVSMQSSTALYEATHTTPLSFVLEALPYAWVGIFALMAVLAYTNLRHTKRGYKYQLTHILGSCLVFSMLGGVVLHFAGVGFYVDAELGKYMAMYASQEKLELSMWQKPAEGRLVGRFVEQSNDPEFVQFADVTGVVWRVDISELQEDDIRNLYDDTQVRLLGLPDPEATNFHSCGVFPWMFHAAMPYESLRAEREAFIERMRALHIALNRLEQHELPASGVVMKKCMHMPIVPRFETSLINP